MMRTRLLRWPEVRAAGIWPASRSGFYFAIRDGKLPGPVKLGRISAWREDELRAAVEALINGERDPGAVK